MNEKIKARQINCRAFCCLNRSAEHLLSLQSHVHGVAVNGGGDAEAAVYAHNLTGGEFCGCEVQITACHPYGAAFQCECFSDCVADTTSGSVVQQIE